MGSWMCSGSVVGEVLVASSFPLPTAVEDGSLRPVRNCALGRDDSNCLARPRPRFFVVELFPLRPKTLYGAPRFALGEI
jgi:hypothetical protein